MTYKAYENINEIAAIWDSVLPSHHHLSSSLIKVLERSDLKNTRFRYLIFLDQRNQPVGVAYFQWLHFTKEHYAFPLAKNSLLRWIEDMIVSKGFSILACGNLLRINAPGLYYHPNEVSSSDIFFQLEHFYKTLIPNPHAILIKDWQFVKDQYWVSQFNYQPWQEDMTMKLTLNTDWNDITDYVKSLRHRYSQRYRKITRELHPIIRRELRDSEIKLFEKELETLYQNVVQKQPIRLVIVNGKYFSEMKSALGERFIIMGYFLDEKLVAFSSNISHNTYWELHYIGLDYSHNKQHFLYFNILYNAIGDAIQHSKPELELGRTARNTKMMIGADEYYFRNYVKIKNRTARLLTGYLRNFFNSLNEVDSTVSKPFRNEEIKFQSQSSESSLQGEIAPASE